MAPRAWGTMVIVFAVALSADLWSKSWAFRNVAGKPVVLVYEEARNPDFRPPYHNPMQVVPGDLLDFSLVVNHGAVFGIGQNRRSVFVAFTLIAVAVAVWIFGWWTRAGSWAAHLGIGLVLAGGIGNLHDRLVYGAVRDFLHMFPRWNLPFGWALAGRRQHGALPVGLQPGGRGAAPGDGRAAAGIAAAQTGRLGECRARPPR